VVRKQIAKDFVFRVKTFSHTFNPNRSLDHNVSGILVFVLFPNIFYSLVGILPAFVT